MWVGLDVSCEMCECAVAGAGGADEGVAARVRNGGTGAGGPGV